MEEYPLAPLDRVNLIIMGSFFVLWWIAAIVAIGALVSGGALFPVLWFASLILAVFAGTWAWSPRAVRVTPTGLVIVRRLLPPLLFPWTKFACVEILSQWRGWKVCGSGGFYGYFGWYWGRDLGSFRCYATRRTGAVVLHGNPTVLVTPSDPAQLQRAIAATTGLTAPRMSTQTENTQASVPN